jgi:transposase
MPPNQRFRLDNRNDRQDRWKPSIHLDEEPAVVGRITKRGNRYLRMLFIQGARAVLLRPASWAKHSFGSWLTAATRRLHRNVLAVALANKLARIAWTVLAQGRRYEARVEPRVEAAA